MMEIRTLPVDFTSGEFLLWKNDKVIDYGNLEDIKETLADLFYDGKGVILDIDDFHISLNTPLEDSKIEIKTKITVKMEDSDYSTEEEEFIIRRDLRVMNTFSDEDTALEYLAQVIEEEGGREDLFNLERKVHYSCTYDMDKEIKVNISIPNQPVRTEVITKEFPANLQRPQDMSDEEIQRQLELMYIRVQELSGEKARRLANTF